MRGIGASEQALVAALVDPAARPAGWAAGPVEVVETHASLVLLFPDHVVKIKRAVDYGFLDYGTLEKRRQACLDEVRLNRRLTEGVYLEVVPITAGPQGLFPGGDGPAIEWAVVMRRLPAAGMLDAMLARGVAPDDLAARLSDRLVPFVRAAPPCGDADATAAIAVLRDNLAGIAPFVDALDIAAQFAFVRDAVAAAIDTHADLLHARARAGWQRDGHGDLRCEHVCLEADGATQIYDCVEFSADIRCADVASDLAFLLADLRRLGAAAVADDLVARLRGAGIDLPAPLLALFATHRALVRVKVAAISQHEQALPAAERRAFAAQAHEWLHLATGSALRVGPCVLAMTGLSGTGKTTVAADLARATGAAVWSSDLVRREVMAGASDRYDPANRLAIYDRLLAHARPVLAAGRPVLLDAAFLRTTEREHAATLAAEAGVPLIFVETRCPAADADARVAARTAAGDSPSDADLAVVAAQRVAVAADPPGVPAGAEVAVVDTGGDGPWSHVAVWRTLATRGLVRSALA